MLSRACFELENRSGRNETEPLSKQNYREEKNADCGNNDWKRKLFPKKLHCF